MMLRALILALCLVSTGAVASSAREAALAADPVAEKRLHTLIDREIKANCLPTPELSGWVRLQSRMAHLPLLLAESWSVAWIRLLSAKPL